MLPTNASAPPPSRPPNTLEVLERIEAKLDRLERVLGPLSVLGEVPAVVGTALETLDDRARGRELELDARLRGAVALLERASRPGTLERLHAAIDLTEALPGLVATAVDTVDHAAGSEGLGLHARVEAGLELLGRLTDPQTLALVSRMIVLLRHAQTQGERRVGLLGLVKALRDPHVQRAVGFAVDVLEGLGRTLDSTANKSLPPAQPPPTGHR